MSDWKPGDPLPYPDIQRKAGSELIGGQMQEWHNTTDEPVRHTPTHTPPEPQLKIGWQCPVCKAVNAPWMPTCGRCREMVERLQFDERTVDNERYVANSERRR